MQKLSRRLPWNLVSLGTILLTSLIFHIRLVDGSKDFFDSWQYVWRSAGFSLLDAASTGHPPFHPAYVGLSWLIHSLAPHYPNIEWYTPAIVNVIATLAMILLTYLIAKKLKLSERVALLAAALLALNPFFMGMGNIIVDPGMDALLLLALYLLLGPIKPEIVLLSGGTLGLALLFHTQAGLWSLLWLGILWYRSIPLKLKSWPWVLFAVGPIMAIALYVYLLLVHASHDPSQGMAFNTWRSALKYLFLGNVGDRDSLSLAKLGYLIVAELTTLGTILAAIGAVILARRDRRTALFIALWVLPGALFGSAYIYENLYGRAIFFAIPALVMLAAIVLDEALSRSRVWGIALVVFTLTLLAVPAVSVWARYEGQPSPNDRLGNVEASLAPDGVFVGTNITKTWAAYHGTHVGFGDINVGSGLVKSLAATADAAGKPVYLLSDAIQFPLYRSDGAYADLRSTKTGNALGHSTQLGEVFEHADINLVQTIPGPLNRRVYLVTPPNHQSLGDRVSANVAAAGDRVVIVGQLPAPRLIVNAYSKNQFEPLSNDNFLRNDPFITIWHMIRGTVQPIAWTVTDSQGVFVLTVPKEQRDQIQLVVASFPEQTGGLEAKSDVFFKRQATTLNLGDCTEPAAGPSRWSVTMGWLTGDTSETNQHCFDYTVAFDSRIYPPIDKAIYHPGQHEPYIMTGPYVYLPAGQYTIHYEISSSRTNDVGVGTIDFTGSSPVQHELRGTDFRRANEFEDLTLELTTSEPSPAFEVRVSGNGEATLVVRSVWFERH